MKSQPSPSQHPPSQLVATTSPQRTAVVGGGLLGLTLALRLAERGHRVTLLEAAPELGGLASAWQIGHITWDRHYHVTLLSDSYIRQLLREIGLDQSMQWVQTRTGFYVDGQLHSFSSSLDFLKFPPLSLVDKFRLGWTIWWASKVTDWKSLEKIPVATWLTKLSGKRTFEKIWLPLLKAKLGNAWERTSAAFIWATIQRLYAARRSGMKREMFGYLPGGYARLLTKLREHLQSRGIEIRTSFPVNSIEQTSADEQGTRELAVTSSTGESLTFDRVVCTAAAPLAARMCPELSDSERARLQGVEYLGIVCASLLLKKPLAGYYVTNITDEAPFTGVIEMSALVKPEELGGHHLVYLPKYVTADDRAAKLTDVEIEASFTSSLLAMFPHLSRDDISAFRISRVKHVFALQTLGYSERVPAQTTSIPGLFLVNSSQIESGTLNVNETVRLAEMSLDTICSNPQPTSVIERSENVATDRELVARS